MIKKIQIILDKIESNRKNSDLVWVLLVNIKDFLFKLKINFYFSKEYKIKKELHFYQNFDSKYISLVKKSSGIIHIGAHVGQESKLYNFYNKKVVWIEANPKICDILNKNIKKYKNQIVVNALITDKSDVEYDFKISNNNGESSSIFDFGPYHQGEKSLWEGDFKMVDTLKLKSETLNSIYQKYNLKDKNINTLILDIQGGELLALKGAGDLLYNFKYIYIEVSTVEIYKNGALWLDIKEYLHKYGFIENKEPVNCENVLFVRELEFNDDILLSNKIKNFIIDNKINNIVETGTYTGNTTRFFADNVEQVYTVDVDPYFYNIAKNRMDMPLNINFYLGDSWDVLDKEIIHLIKNKNTLFFLDAHWHNPCPTPLELDVIAKHGIKPFILIHDFKVPDHPELYFDTYEDFEYSYGNIKDILDNIYGVDSYVYEYNTEAVGACRGVILISPK